MDATDEVRFNGWTLHRRAGELVRDGKRTRLQGQPLRVLEALLECPGQLVTREQLIARLWPNGVVDYDTALNSAVRRLRTALDDHAETPRYIETLPRRGYRFVGAVEPLPLPPKALDVPALVERPRTESPTAYRPWGRVAAAAALILVVAVLLLPRFAGDPAVSASVAEAPANTGAEELHTRARHLFQRRAAGDVARAREYFEQVVRLEPGHARAWAGLAGTYWIGTIEGHMAPEEGLARLRDAAERALALDPHLAEAHLRLANYRSSVGDRAGQKAHLSEALRLEPDSPAVLSLLASIAAREGRLGDAVKLQRRAVEANPLSQVDRYNLASFLFLSGRLSETEAEMTLLRELYPEPTQLSSLLGYVLVLEGRYDEALALADTLPDEVDRLEIQAMARHGLGFDAEADAALGSFSRLVSDEPLRLASVHAFRGECDLAFQWLASARFREELKPWENPSRHRAWTAQFSPVFEPLHADPRWPVWVESVALDSTPIRLSAAPRLPGGEDDR